ncbi:type II secretion system protein N [Sphingomicrobium sediminis]|uniref:Type II secretion system protein N n=1 Tax=Sphingomicrobium sediminis TaxID=2950949 RepID=A0A9X2EMM9_9SPHN|nr:type II secretion system protein N [Sphingomicrobium sediminis]MCM8558194.1 type II secretion system protein N [Sphingomicrobium sediminis]
MNRRILIVSLGVFALALAVLFPLRLALGGALGSESPLSARQVAGSIWAGRVGDAMIGPERLGTFDVGLKPLPILTGQQHAMFERLNDPDGPLSGTLLPDPDNPGVIGLSGQLGASRLLDPLPIDSLIFDNATARFENGSCAGASGTMTAVPAGAIRPLVPSLTGPLSCAEDGRLQLSLLGGEATLDIFINANGEAESILDIANVPPALAVPLGSAGFISQGNGVRLVGGGRLL